MIATLRRQHGGGRDFLQENKQRVSRMETNGRCLAAATARRVPLWRPVALHYTEKLRPHLNFGGLRHPRLSQAPPERASGLAQPYMGSGSGAGVAKVTPPCGRRRQAEQQEQVRLQGGWVDPRRQERPVVRRCCHPECQCHQGPEVSVPPPLKAGEGDQLSQCPSRVSRASQRERSLAGGGEPEAPLSARSSASAMSHKSKRSVSQESNRSNITVKSNATVKSNVTSASQKSSASKQSNASRKSNASNQSNASKHTITSKKSQVSHKSAAMEEMPLPEYQECEHHQHQHQHYQQQHHQSHQAHQSHPSHPHHEHSESKAQEPAQQEYEGYTPLTPAQRQAIREDAQLKYGKLMEEYNHLPVSAPTLRVRSRRIAIEKQLDELDYAINMFDQPHMDMYYKR